MLKTTGWYVWSGETEDASSPWNFKTGSSFMTGDRAMKWVVAISDDFRKGGRSCRTCTNQFDDAELVRKKGAAMFGGFITRPPDEEDGLFEKSDKLWLKDQICQDEDPLVLFD